MTDWSIETSRPEDHPMWEAQIDLENGMLQAGAKRVRDMATTAKEERDASRLRPVRALITEWLPTVATGITHWIKDNEAMRGVKPEALPLIKMADPYVTALIGLRVILDRIGAEANHITSLAMTIGQTLEHELKVERWEREEPELFYKLDKMLTRDGATSRHRARVNINRFNHHLARGTFGFGWESWGTNAKLRVGVAIIDIITRYTAWFEIGDDPRHSGRVRPSKQSFRPKHTLLPRAELVAHISAGLNLLEMSSPTYLPTLMPPKRWDGTRQGGYYTPYVRPPRLIRFKASQENQRNGAADEYEALDMPAMYAAVHALQEVPYIVNERILEIAQAADDRGTGIGGLPSVIEEELPFRSAAHEAYLAARLASRKAGLPDPDPSEALARDMSKWRRRAKMVKARNAKRGSAMVHHKSIMGVATQFVGKEFYYPHMLDFRGRLYPIPAGLSPQGNDLAKGLLLFANSVVVTEENGGAGWLAIHVANTWGHDKLTLDERIAWTEDNWSMLERCADEPLQHLDWSVADKPWQALAATLDWVAYRRSTEPYYSHVPVMVDGTCNGIQHLSAITRDQVSGRLVNLTPQETQQDIYGEVAKRVQKRLTKMRGDALADYWLDVTGGTLPRSLTKRQTMVIPYGGTKDSCFGYTLEWMDEHDPINDDADPETYVLRYRRAGFMRDEMWTVLNEVVAGGMKVMSWLRACAGEAAIADQPIFWTTPAGFVVRHFYGKIKERQIELKLNGERHQLRVHEVTKELDRKGQLLGVAPNFIHSLDAAALVTCLELCGGMGLTDITAIHDAYGTHAGNMWALDKLIRASFVDIHRKNPLDAFRSACAAVMTDVLLAQGVAPDKALEEVTTKLNKVAPPLQMGTLKIEEVLKSDYFFA